MTDLDYIHKAIIESKGCEGDDFPYEYYCPDDFSVVINPEDWTIEQGWTYAEKQIPTQIKVPEGYELKIGTCNNADYSVVDGQFNLEIAGIADSCIVGFDVLENIIGITVYEEFDPSEADPITLNFKDLIFLGNKK